MLADYAARFPGKIIPARQENRGGTAARNTGARIARGDFLNFLDHDDLFLPEKIERQMMLFEAEPALGLVHCGFFQIDKDGRLIDIRNHLPEGDVLVHLVQGCFLWSGAPLISRKCIDHVGLFDENVWSSDAEMWLRIALAGYRFGCIQSPMGCYRILPDSGMAEVSRTEKGDISVMDRVFADPRLPSEAFKKKDQAYFNERSWLAFRYYAVGRAEDARRNFMEALSLKPLLMGDPQALLQMIVSGILDLRVPDPVRHADYVLNHLPPEITALLQPHRESVISRVYFILAMRSFGFGEIEQAKRQISKSIQLDPGLAGRTEDVANTVISYATNGVISPMEFVGVVLGNLPFDTRSLNKLRVKILSEVAFCLARREFWSGKRQDVPGLLWSAFRYRPSSLRNPRKLAQLVLSLPAFLAQKLKAVPTGNGNNRFALNFSSTIDLVQRK